MTRPYYETGKNIKEEVDVIDMVKEFYDLEAIKNPLNYRVDFSLISNSVIICFAEVKCRTNESTKYSTYLISLGKWIAGISLSRETGIPFKIIVKFTDCVMEATVSDLTKKEIRIGGRRDRGDWQDQEPCVFIPMHEFSRVAKKMILPKSYVDTDNDDLPF